METVNSHWWNPAQSLNRMLLSPTLAKRGLAMMLDLAFVSALQFGLSQVFGVNHIIADGTTGSVINGDGFSFYAIQFALIPYGWLVGIVVAYFSFFELLFGATPGKSLLGLQVVTLDGRRPSLRAILIRNIFRLVDVLPVFYIVGGLVAQCTEYEQRVGDILAQTCVVPRARLNADLRAIRRLPLKLLLLGVILAALVSGAGAFQYYARGPLVIQSWANVNNNMDSNGHVCGAFQPWPLPSGAPSAFNFQAPGRIFQYGIGAPQWGNGVVTYPIRMQLWNNAHDSGYGPIEPIQVSSIAAVGSGPDIYSGSITLRWAGPLTGWVMQGGQLAC